MTPVAMATKSETKSAIAGTKEICPRSFRLAGVFGGRAIE